MAYTLFYVFPAEGGAGLTLEALFRNTAGTPVGSVLPNVAVDMGGGDYGALISHPDSHVGLLEFRIASAGARQALFAVNPQEGENVDTKISTRADVTTQGEMHGLLGKHSALSGANYSSNNLTSYLLRIYDTAAHATANDGATGLLHSYAVTNTYSSGGNLLTSIMTRVS